MGRALRTARLLRHDPRLVRTLWTVPARNSSEQVRSGKAIPLDGMSGPAKEQAIIARAVPMLTLLGAPGHIMLYLGQRDSKAMILHNTWGVKVRQAGGAEGFTVIGRCCITTLRPGIELPNVVLPEGDLRHMINVMVSLEGLFDKPQAATAEAK